MDTKTVDIEPLEPQAHALSRTLAKLLRVLALVAVLLILLSGFVLGFVAIHQIGQLLLNRDVAIAVAAGLPALLVGLVAYPLYHVTQNAIVQRLLPSERLENQRRAQTRSDIVYSGSLTGQRIGTYELQEVIGRGGMAEVYQAVGNETIVAVKVLHAHYLYDEENLRRFYREGQFGLGISHPHIAAVYEVGDYDERPYIVMEFIDGEDLRSIIRRTDEYALNDVILWIHDICSALDVAHARGYVHRDIKPSNIMIRPNGEAVVMDFGIAKFSHATTAITGASVGTIDYMAPEQIQNSPYIDHRADIYTLGVVTFEMLTGFLPYDGSIAQIMYAHINDLPPDPREFRRNLPEHLAAAVMQAMAKHPEDRFQSAGDFARALLG